MDFGQRLTTARKQKGISQEALADSLGVSRQAVSKWETGESKPDVNNLIALCDKLELNIEYLCFGTVPFPEKKEKKGLSHKTKVLLSIMAAVFCLLIGGFVGSLIVFSYIDANDTEQEHKIDIESISVANVTVNRQLDKDGYFIVVTPGFAHEEVEVLLLVESNETSFTLPCEFGGFYYRSFSDIRGRMLNIESLRFSAWEIQKSRFQFWISALTIRDADMYIYGKIKRNGLTGMTISVAVAVEESLK